MFEEIQRVNENAIEQLKTDNYNKNVETRKLAKSLFGISPSDDDEEPEAGMDLQRLAKVRSESNEAIFALMGRSVGRLTSSQGGTVI